MVGLDYPTLRESNIPGLKLIQRGKSVMFMNLMAEEF